MTQIDFDSQFEATNDALQSDVEQAIVQMVITDKDLISIRFTEVDMEGMVLGIEDVMAMTDEDWARLRFYQNDLALLREDLIRRLGVSAKDVPWLSRAIERGQHGHKRA